jgi:pyruvate,orthophosphate dikinase
MPDTYRQLAAVFEKLEKHYRDMQDIEFTIQEGKLWMLQTRSGKRTTKAALKVAVDLVAEGLIAPEEAVLRIDAGALDQPCTPPSTRRRSGAGDRLAGLAGRASGEIVFDADEAEALKATAAR